MSAPKLKFAWFDDWIAVGYSKEDEEGGFHVVGDVTDAVRYIEEERDMWKDSAIRTQNELDDLRKALSSLGHA